MPRRDPAKPRRTGLPAHPDPDDARRELAAVFYAMLCGHEPFVRDLAALIDKLERLPVPDVRVQTISPTGGFLPSPSDDPDPWWDDLAERMPHGRTTTLGGSSTPAAGWAFTEAVVRSLCTVGCPIGGMHADQEQEAAAADGPDGDPDDAALHRTTAAVVRLLADFCTRWPLPATAPLDVFEWWRWYMKWARRKKRWRERQPFPPIRPTIASFFLPVPDDVSEITLPDGTKKRWNPSTDTAADLSKLTNYASKDERRAIRAQTDPLERQATDAGSVAPSAHALRPERAQIRAGRLFHRLVLGWTFEAISDREYAHHAEDDPPPSPTSVRMDVAGAVRLLAIMLPAP